MDEFHGFDRLLAHRSGHDRFEPNTDVYLDEGDGSVVVHVELAGADADSLRVALDGSYLFIAGRRAPRDVGRDASLLRKEIPYGEFVKRIRLPIPVEDDAASAVYRDGILSIRLPVATTQSFPIVRTELRMTVRRTLA